MICHMQVKKVKLLDFIIFLLGIDKLFYSIIFSLGVDKVFLYTTFCAVV